MSSFFYCFSDSGENSATILRAKIFTGFLKDFESHHPIKRYGLINELFNMITPCS